MHFLHHKTGWEVCRFVTAVQAFLFDCRFFFFFSCAGENREQKREKERKQHEKEKWEHEAKMERQKQEYIRESEILKFYKDVVVIFAVLLGFVAVLIYIFLSLLIK